MNARRDDLNRFGIESEQVETNLNVFSGDDAIACQASFTRIEISFFEGALKIIRPWFVPILWLEIRRACARPVCCTPEGNKEIKNLVIATPGRRTVSNSISRYHRMPYRFPLPSAVSLYANPLESIPPSFDSFTLVCAKVFPLCAQHNLFHPVWTHLAITIRDHVQSITARERRKIGIGVGCRGSERREYLEIRMYGLLPLFCVHFRVYTYPGGHK